jgi:hypothetical protein
MTFFWLETSPRASVVYVTGYEAKLTIRKVWHGNNTALQSETT